MIKVSLNVFITLHLQHPTLIYHYLFQNNITGPFTLQMYCTKRTITSHYGPLSPSFSPRIRPLKMK